MRTHGARRTRSRPCRARPARTRGGRAAAAHGGDRCSRRRQGRATPVRATVRSSVSTTARAQLSARQDPVQTSRHSSGSPARATICSRAATASANRRARRPSSPSGRRSPPPATAAGRPGRAQLDGRQVGPSSSSHATGSDARAARSRCDGSDDREGPPAHPGARPSRRGERRRREQAREERAEDVPGAAGASPTGTSTSWRRAVGLRERPRDRSRSTSSRARAPPPTPNPRRSMRSATKSDVAGVDSRTGVTRSERVARLDQEEQRVERRRRSRRAPRRAPARTTHVRTQLGVHSGSGHAGLVRALGPADASPRTGQDPTAEIRQHRGRDRLVVRCTVHLSSSRRRARPVDGAVTRTRRGSCPRGSRRPRSRAGCSPRARGRTHPAKDGMAEGSLGRSCPCSGPTRRSRGLVKWRPRFARVASPPPPASAPRAASRRSRSSSIGPRRARCRRCREATRRSPS